HQLLDVEPRHDRLACPWIVSKQKAQRLARQHFAVDRLDLMWERFEEREMDREAGVEQGRETNPPRLGRKAGSVWITVKAERLRVRLDLELRLVIPEDELLSNFPTRRSIGQRNAGRAMPGSGDDSHGSTRAEARNEGAGR